MTSTLYGFECRACEIVGWPDTDQCPNCGGATDKAEVAGVSTGEMESFRNRAVEEAEGVDPDEVYVLMETREDTKKGGSP